MNSNPSTKKQCPECGQQYQRSEVFEPGIGPNKSDDSVECFYHSGQKMCSRVVK